MFPGGNTQKTQVINDERVVFKFTALIDDVEIFIFIFVRRIDFGTVT